MADHQKIIDIFVGGEATVDAPFENTMLAAQTLEQTWHVIPGRSFPCGDAEKEPFLPQMKTVDKVVDKDPKICFGRVDQLLERPTVSRVEKETSVLCAKFPANVSTSTV